MLKFAAILLLSTALAAPSLTYAEVPLLKSASPVIYLADNLDEKDKLGWCIDTDGRGFAETLQAHSCKPAGNKAKDTQFSFDSEIGQIRSVAYPEYCMAFSDPGNAEWPFGLVKCVAGDRAQIFTYDNTSMEIRIGTDDTQCVVVSPNSISAGPFMSRDLIYANCASVEEKYKQWVIKH